MFHNECTFETIQRKYNSWQWYYTYLCMYVCTVLYSFIVEVIFFCICQALNSVVTIIKNVGCKRTNLVINEGNTDFELFKY